MKRRLFVGGFAAAISMIALVAPAFAHGDHDARPLARHLPAGPHSISLWQVYPDAGTAMTPHLIVMFDDEKTVPPGSVVTVQVNSAPREVRPSTTTSNGLETTTGVAEGDVVAVTVSDSSQTWDLGAVLVPAPPTSLIPMPELIYTSIFLTLGTAVWVARRTSRAWRRPSVTARVPAVIPS